MAKKFPARIFVKYETPRNDEPYLVACPLMYGLVDAGTTTKIATYQLVETVDAEMIVSASKPTKAKA